VIFNEFSKYQGKDGDFRPLGAESAAQFMTHALGHAELFGRLREWNLFEQRWLCRIILTFFKITHSDAH
jgi:hypothetical protein